MKFLLKTVFAGCLIWASSYNIMAQDSNCTFRSVKYYPSETLGNIWGYADSLGNEYALVGGRTGLSIVNVTNPDSIYQVVKIPGPINLWKEIKTYRHYAYVTTEGGGGLQIVNLANLPDSNLAVTTWAPNFAGNNLDNIHALHIDNGKVYLYGSNLANGGIVVGDLTNPWSPQIVNIYDGAYVHDGIVRNDTAYAGEIYNGVFRVLNMNQFPPTVLNQQATPNNFTHNTWLSDDSKYLFTTDERDNSFLAAYDVSDITDIKFIDKIQTNPGSNSIVHNTYYKDGYCVTSWYTEGFTIVDAHRPHNLVQVGKYDTFFGSGGGFHGAWGVYPYLPSGNVLVSNMDTIVGPLQNNAGALYVVSPNYTRAAYLEGIVRDSVTNAPINNAAVNIFSADPSSITASNASGGFATGTHLQGTYSVSFTKNGYIPKTIQVNFTPGVVDSLEVKLVPIGGASNTRDLEGEPICLFINKNCPISLPAGSTWEADIFDITGKRILANQKVISGQNLNYSGLTSGAYLVRLTHASGEVRTCKLLIP